MNEEMKASASLSEDGLYRYGLTRQWGLGIPMGFVMLNPSTADAYSDDPTIRRCMGFARQAGCSGIVVLNLFSFRTSKPSELWRQPPELRKGPEHWAEMQRYANMLDLSPVVLAWGTGAERDRKTVGETVALFPAHTRFLCVGRTNQGHPKHPLYAPYGGLTSLLRTQI